MSDQKFYDELAALEEEYKGRHYGEPEDDSYIAVFYNTRVTRICNTISLTSPGILVKTRVVVIPGVGLRNVAFIYDERYRLGLRNWHRQSIWADCTEEWMKEKARRDMVANATAEELAALEQEQKIEAEQLAAKAKQEAAAKAATEAEASAQIEANKQAADQTEAQGKIDADEQQRIANEEAAAHLKTQRDAFEATKAANEEAAAHLAAKALREAAEREADEVAAKADAETKAKQEDAAKLASSDGAEGPGKATTPAEVTESTDTPSGAASAPAATEQQPKRKGRRRRRK